MSSHIILCVDDDHDVLESLRFHVDMQQDLKGEFFHNPTDAIRAIENGLRPAIALVDIRMPEISGIEFMTELKDMSPQTIRVNMSSHADLNVVLEAIQANNIFGFIRKPISTHDLANTLHNALQTFLLQAERDQLSQDLEKKNIALQEWNQKLDEEVKHKTLELQIRDDLMQHLSGSRPLEEPFKVIDRFAQVFLPKENSHGIYRRVSGRYLLIHPEEHLDFPKEIKTDDLGFKGPEPDPNEWAQLLGIEGENLGCLEILKHHGHPLGIWVISGTPLGARAKTQVQVFTPLVSLLLYDIISLDEASILTQQNDLFH